MDRFWHLAAWPVDNSAMTSAAARRGERKSEKGLDGAFPYHQKFYQLVKVLPFGQSIFMPSTG